LSKPFILMYLRLLPDQILFQHRNALADEVKTPKWFTTI